MCMYTLENSLIIHLFHFLATLKHLVFVSESFLLSHANHLIEVTKTRCLRVARKWKRCMMRLFSSV
jgi:hypothetical protein